MRELEGDRSFVLLSVLLQANKVRYAFLTLSSTFNLHVNLLPIITRRYLVNGLGIRLLFPSSWRDKDELLYYLLKGAKSVFLRFDSSITCPVVIIFQCNLDYFTYQV